MPKQSIYLSAKCERSAYFPKGLFLIRLFWGNVHPIAPFTYGLHTDADTGTNTQSPSDFPNNMNTDVKLQQLAGREGGICVGVHDLYTCVIL